MRPLPLLLSAAILAAKAWGMEVAPSPEAVRPIAVGAVAPTAVLDSVDGGKADLAALFADKPTILIFYRGGWCPFCNRHLASLADYYLQFRELGYQVVAISPDPDPVLGKTAARQHLLFRLLSDRGLKVSGDFKVAFRISAADEKDYRANGISLPQIPGQPDFWLPIPTAFVIGRDGRVKFVYFNPDPSVPISATALLDAAKAAAR